MQNHRTTLSAGLVLPLAFLTACKADRQPNILFILADDYGWNDTGATGSTYYETPNIDRIAANGVNFTQSYAACQVSSPSRASIMTGLFTARHGITDWIGEKSGEEWRSMGRQNMLLPADYEHELDYKRFACLPQVLHDGGYTTAIFGKWHLGETSTPELAGFDVNVGAYWAGSPRGGYFPPYNNPKLTDGPRGENLSMRLARETNGFLENHVKTSKGKPFFAYLSFYAVHGPIQTTRERWRYFRDKAVEAGISDTAFAIDRTLPVRQHQDNPVYAGLIQQMDISVGMVLDKLKELHLDRNTIVIFASDNGGVSSGDSYSSSMLPLRGGKGRQWEGGLRVPLFISVPPSVAKSARGVKCNTPVCSVDMMPTILDYAGIECPEGLDGVSLRALIEGGEIGERPLFWHYPHYGNQGGEPSSIIRKGDWKLIQYHEDGRYELYNLKEDEAELHECLAGHEDIADSMAAELGKWLLKSGAKMPVPDPEYDAGSSANYWAEHSQEVLREQTRIRNNMLEDSWRPNKDWWGSSTID